ncbi:subtilisin-like protease 4 [Elaeis guineensis]|uniref:subtilisin-like protease 4 n=1 Tax=Elaeis guineensis var. tenera TaxID=51953 RepID=UPI003C6DACC1
MEAIDGFVYAEPDKQHKLRTTYTPNFLGLSQFDGAWGGTLLGEGIVIGVIDTGIHASHPSFNDSMMPPPPLKWRGRCRSSGFACNNKIVGAMGFLNGTRAPATDDDGHGTHVASTAAGNFVDDAEVLGTAKGVASGMAPRAHLAIYKVCFQDGCSGSDIYAAIDQAIKDGVDVLSMSISGAPDATFYQDPVAIGSLAAVEKGIFPCAAAGNNGPKIHTVNHDAPWVLAVGASSTDRRIGATVKLGNGMELEGESAFQPSSFDSTTLLPLVFPGMYGDLNASYCLKGSLDYIDVYTKVVLCWSGAIKDTEKGEVVYAAGGAAMIVMNLPRQGYTIFSEAHILPAAHVSFVDGMMIRDYVYFNSAPTATIVFHGTEFGVRPSPAVAAFSSRGPALMNGGILKPDVLAPGVNILAAWPFDVGPNPSALATKTFNFESGTSMATPHVSGIVALIKNVHPNWSPAVIQSAIITSAKDLDLDGNIIVDGNSNNTADIFATGAGQVNPAGALDPGLVYDRSPSNYIGYLCGIGYNDTEVTMMARQRVRCSGVKAIGAAQLNYPSISATLNSSMQSLTFERTVTNMGKASEVYLSRIREPIGVRVDLSTYQLKFSRVGQQRSFTVRLSMQGSHGSLASARGKLEWVSKDHVVASPIAISFT